MTSNQGKSRQSAQSIRTDINYFEARLGEMGYDGDCAYERAMAKLYEKLVAERRESLARISGTSLC